MSRVAVLYNVDFEERRPSADAGFLARADVASAVAAVAESLRAARHEALLVPVDGDLQRTRETLAALGPDCALNLVESLAGDARLETAVPVLLEWMGLPYTGSPPEAISAALHKDRVKERLARAGVPTPPACVMCGPDDPFDLDFPVIVKPVREDGSLGIDARSVVHDERALRERVAERVERHAQPCLVERFVEGRELNVALFGHPTARVLPLQEIDFGALPEGAPRVVTYDAKWRAGSADDLGTRPVLLVKGAENALPPGVAARVRRVAAAAFAAVGVRDYGRVDVRVDASGAPHVVDVNPNCDLSPAAGLARAASAVGLDHTALVRLLVRYALARRVTSARPSPLPRRPSTRGDGASAPRPRADRA
jgi:D-alanine-D-alanine ligase